MNVLSPRPESVGERLDAVLGDAVDDVVHVADPPRDARRIDDPSARLLDERQERHRDVNQAVQIDRSGYLVVVNRHPLGRTESAEDASVVYKPHRPD